MLTVGLWISIQPAVGAYACIYTHTHTLTPNKNAYLVATDYLILFFLKFVYLRESTSWRGAEREGERENPK